MKWRAISQTKLRETSNALSCSSSQTQYAHAEINFAAPTPGVSRLGDDSRHGRRGTPPPTRDTSYTYILCERIPPPCRRQIYVFSDTKHWVPHPFRSEIPLQESIFSRQGRNMEECQQEHSFTLNPSRRFDRPTQSRPK